MPIIGLDSLSVLNHDFKVEGFKFVSRWWKNIFARPIFFPFISTFSTFFSIQKTLVIFTKNPKNWKNIQFQFLSITVFRKMFPHLTWNFQSYIGRKKGTSETFLSIDLFISWPRPQKCSLGFEKLFLRSLFSTPITSEKFKSDVEKFYFRGDMENNWNKIPFSPKYP